MSAACFFCGVAAAAGEHPGNALCTEHHAIHAHTVAITNPGGKYRAECRCGWVYQGALPISTWPIAANCDREEAVRSHWQAVLERVAA